MPVQGCTLPFFYILPHLNALQEHAVFFVYYLVHSMSENALQLKAAGLSEICILSQVLVFVVIIVIIIIIILFLNKQKLNFSV